MPSYAITSGLTTFWEMLVHAAAALEANEQAALAAEVERHLEGFEPLHKAELEMLKALRKVLARMKVGDMRLDRALRDLQTDLLAEVKQKREAPAYAALFDGSITEVVKYALAQQIEVAKEKHRVLTGSKELYSAAFVEAQAPRLLAAIQFGEAIVEARRAHEVAHADHRLRAEDWKRGANAVLMAVEGELLKVASASGEPRAWVKNFFA